MNNENAVDWFLDLSVVEQENIRSKYFEIEEKPKDALDTCMEDIESALLPEPNIIAKSSLKEMYRFIRTLTNDQNIVWNNANVLNVESDEDLAIQIVVNQLAEEIHQTAIDHGWWEYDRDPLHIMMLIVTELAEAAEGYKQGNPNDSHLPEYPSIDVEIIDVIIRCLDYLGHRGTPAGNVLIAKMNYNKQRPYRHGDKKA